MSLLGCRFCLSISWQTDADCAIIAAKSTSQTEQHDAPEPAVGCVDFRRGIPSGLVIVPVERQRGENEMQEIIVVSNLSCAVICAKWALDLGLSQIRQVLFLIGGLLFGPIMLLILYVFLINKAKRDGGPGGKVV
jgi:hypothetical protein